MIKGTDKVRQFLIFNKTPYWNLKRSENSAIIFTSTVLGGDGRRKKQDDGDDDDSTKGAISMDEGLQYFDQCIRMLDDGYYFIEAKATREDTKKIMKDTVYLDNFGSKENGKPSIHGIEPGMYSESQVEERVKKALQDHQREQEITALRKTVEELKQDSGDNHINDIIGMVKPYIPMFMQGMYGQKAMPEPSAAAGINGINANNNGTMANEQQGQEQAKQRFYAAAAKWNKAEPQIVELMEKIAELAEKKDAMYMMVKSTLLKK